ncbi:related to acyl-CoA synthetases (AMP-forming)/AMP-acid ligases II [Ramularia collo-cygni]|uniref:Related to acyl-CoA synthetases (AMP-forming)/AMP-acid ligases II n=1 Tax=Ramularia collo-cygni TaxID=112498 RepID=A0A2D3VL58_9PEZI|nr:related to acyl-CoA synthetases (AMP-forming)/AMP-acid ligases II [Ramularia collo-cygni]CZT24279.1 related to acyl-CoA synthetases (AMP-forming)/AMP-acid ligases II [Ramularia collo-cygni]
MGFLGAFTHGSSVVFPSQQFDPAKVLDAIQAERCTILYGVPTMYGAALDVNSKSPRNLSSLKLALAAGSPVPQRVVKRLEEEMGIKGVLIAYGMTETSPVTFATQMSDSFDQRLGNVGTVFPHTTGKIIDLKGEVVPRGVAGEICVSGFTLQQGYLRNAEKTNEVMKTDSAGTRWMHTGDEGIIDAAGYLRVTGRIKDMIIRGKHVPYQDLAECASGIDLLVVGGENITPVEVEERLLAHPSVVEAAVVGVPHVKYGETVSCFLRQAEQTSRPTASELVAWVRETLGRHKAPEHIWWIGDAAVGPDFPKTASGKHQKHTLRALGTNILKGGLRAKL